MKIRIYTSIFIAAALSSWIGYCFGNFVALNAGEKRKAEIAYSDTKIMLSAAHDIKSKNYDKAINTLNEVAQFRLFYIETTRADLNSLSLIKSILRPDIMLENFTLDSNTPFPSNEEMDQLKYQLDIIEQ